jgi:hypothetical protein
MRDDFPKPVVETLAKRVGNRCSNPGCRKRTSGPHTDDNKALNVGVAAHITAASIGGPRPDPSMSSEDRKGIGNGIWLCRSCAKLVDNDETRYTRELLLQWKRDAEQEALREIEHATQTLDSKDTEICQVSQQAQRVRRPTKCPECGRSMENVGADPNNPPDWQCQNSRCLSSVWHRDSRCPKCGKRPAEITDGGVGYTSFLCEDGHPFMTYSPHEVTRSERRNDTRKSPPSWG